MLNNTQKEFINQLSEYLPDRRGGKRGQQPIDKKVLIKELFILFRTNCGWRNIKHSSTCRNYLKEIQRRGLCIKFLNFITAELTKNRCSKNIVDSSDIVSYKTMKSVKYSGKYHNLVIKFTIVVTEELVPIFGMLDKGTQTDSLILDKIFIDRHKKPYELFLDKGYERYERRRLYKKDNCQIRMEMRNMIKSRKRGPKFSFSQEQKKIRGSIEKVVGWIKAFMIMRLNRLRIKSLITATFFFCLSYVAFIRLQKF